MMAMLLLWLSCAIGSPCVTPAQRPVGGRLHYWDLSEGRADSMSTRSSEKRRAAIERLEGVFPSSATSPRMLLETRLRLALLYSAEGRYWVRCSPTKEPAEHWLQRALQITEVLMRDNLNDQQRESMRRVRSDAFCGLQLWDQCLESIAELRVESSDLVSACEEYIWTAEYYLANGDLKRSISAFTVAAEDAAYPECRYAWYGLAKAHLAFNNTLSAMQSLAHLADAEVTESIGPQVSVVLESVVLDISEIKVQQTYSDEMDVLAWLYPMLVQQLLKPVAVHQRRSRKMPHTYERSIESFLSLNMYEEAFVLVLMFDINFGENSRWGRWRVRRRRWLQAARESYERILLSFISHAAQHPSKGRVDALGCRVADIYHQKFSNSSQAERMHLRCPKVPADLR